MLIWRLQPVRAERDYQSMWDWAGAREDDWDRRGRALGCHLPSLEVCA